MSDYWERMNRNIRMAEAYSSSRAFDPPDDPDCLEDCNGIDEETGDWDDAACDCAERIEIDRAEALLDD
jgi:hypothetical protein